MNNNCAPSVKWFKPSLAEYSTNWPNRLPAAWAGFHCAIPVEPSVGFTAFGFKVGPDSTQKLPIIPHVCSNV